MEVPAPRFVDVNGVRLQVTEAGESGSPVLLLAHGFPELAYSWRRQIPVLAAAGYHVLAPDQRGYGGSSCPDAITDYDIHALTADLAGLLDAVGAARAVLDRTRLGRRRGVERGAVASGPGGRRRRPECAPIPRPLVAPTEAFRRFGEDFYMLRFQEPGVADAELGADPAATMRALFAGAADAPLPDWISAAELDHYAAEFGRTGFTGGLNWYRNLDRNWATTEQVPARTIAVPALFIGGRQDPALTFTRTDRAREVVTGPYREEFIDGAGHWVQQDSADDVNRILLEFLNGLERW